ncbi:MAG TPA: ABC transporter permease [Opitutaceae bacterium]|nr:ABC transporter permease [Opitutaceae bacterium]
MDHLRRLVARFVGLLRRGQVEADIAEELRSHVERDIESNLRSGMSPDEARLAAQRRFGGLAQVQEHAREERLLLGLDQTLRDLRFAARQLAGSRGFTLVATLTLALGIGANTAIFSAVDAVLLRPQPYRDPGRLVFAHELLPTGQVNAVTGASFIHWRDHQTKFESLFLYTNQQLDLTELGEPEKIDSLGVSSGFDRVLGITPLLGRGFRPEDDQLGGDNSVVVLSERFWRSRFDASPSALDRSIVLDGVPHRIIGVLPDRAWFQPHVSIFVPYALWPNSYRTSHEVHIARVIGRLRPGVALAEAQAELNAIKRSLHGAYPANKQSWGVVLRPMQAVLAGDSKPVLLLLLGSVSLVLLISCANVANLLLARASARRREIAVRAALGASGPRLVRQVLTESLLLAALGGAGGVLVAAAGIRLSAALGARLLPATMTPQLDWRVLAFSLVASCGTGLLFGLFPAWTVRRPDLNPSLGSRGTTGSRARSQSWLVVAEVALTAVLLVGTGLLLRQMARTVEADPGIDPRNVLAFGLTTPFREAYRTPEQRIAFLERARAEIRAVPGVVSVATCDSLPFSGGGQGYYFSLQERPETRQQRTGAIKYVSPGYFETLRAAIIRGRGIIDDDNRPGARRVLVVNQRLVDELFGDEDPIGRHLNVADQPWEIVGVAADLRTDDLSVRPRPTFYAAQWHFPWGSCFLVRTQGDPLAAKGAVAAAVHRLDGSLPLARPHSLEQAMAESLGERRLVLALIGAFAATALLLAGIGLYGVISYGVVSRHRELSIRLALGAARADIMRLVVSRGLRLMVVGLVVGLLAAGALAAALSSRVPGLVAGDPLVFGGAAFVLGVVALAASWIPAFRATRADPLRALRTD